MKQISCTIRSAFFAFAFIGGNCQSSHVDDGCAKDAACAKKGRAMLQTKSFKTLETMTTHHHSQLKLSESKTNDYIYTLVYTDERCHPTHWSEPREWGNLGVGLTVQQCQDRCTASGECKWVTFKNGQCTAYTACDTTQTNTGSIGHRTWRKDEVTPTAPTPAPTAPVPPTLAPTFAPPAPVPLTPAPPTEGSSFSYTLVYTDTRCHPTHWSEPREWGNLGVGLTVQQCQDRCTASGECKWVTFKNGQCTSFTACDTTQTNTASIGHQTWKKELATNCRCRANDPCWSAVPWNEAGVTIDDVEPFDWDCSDPNSNAVLEPVWMTSQPQGDQYCGGMGSPDHAGWTAANSTPAKYVAVSDVNIASKTLEFVKEHNLAIVVKSTGHEWFGRNRQVGTLLLFMHPMQELRWFDSFQPASCSQSAGTVIQVGAGVQFLSIYNAMRERRRVFSGGTCSSVGHVGYTLGGGYGDISRLYGSGASNLVEAQVVLADGTIVTTSECNEYRDLHWALRGGGSGFGALVTRATYLTFPEPLFNNIWGVVHVGSGWQAQSQEQKIASAVKFITWYKGLSATGEIKHFGGTLRIQDERVTALLSVVGLSQDECNALIAPLGLMGNGCVSKSLEDRYSGRVCDHHDDAEDAAWCTSYPGSYVTHSFQRYILPSHLDTADKIHAVAEKFITLADCVKPDDAWALRLNYNLGGAPAEVLARNQQTSVHPQVAESLFNFGLLGSRRNVNPQSEWVLDEEIQTCHKRMTDELNEVLPGAGQYVNEGDRSEQNWQQSYWGGNYAQLLAVKQKYDPHNTFQCHQCVGSEDFEKCYKY